MAGLAINGHPLHISAIVLAAGLSRRMENRNKLLEEFNGRPLIEHVIGALLLSTIDEIVVVTGHDSNSVRKAIENPKLQFIQNPHFEEGLSSSLCCGLNAVPSSTHGAMICLGDMPLVTTKVLDELICAFEVQQRKMICVPVSHGRRGNPVLWPGRFFPEMLQSRGDSGARWLMQHHPKSIHEIPVESKGVLRDVDTMPDLQNL